MHPEIRQLGDPVLREIADPFNLSDTDGIKDCTQRLKEVLQDVMEEYDFSSSVGLAATQIGILKRACMICFPDGTPFIMINPEITKRSEVKDFKYEGCMSFFKKRGYVPRHGSIRVPILMNPQGSSSLI